MMTVVISIGRNIQGYPMPASEWETFTAKVAGALSWCDATVHVARAESVGEWQGVREDSRTWVAEVPVFRLGELASVLDQLRVEHAQDAIAFTVGHTELIGA